MQEYILALDQGTTSSRAIVFDHTGKIVASAQKEFKQYFPKPGWVEHDPNEIWAGQIGVAAEAIAKAGLGGGNIKAIGITNQRETTIVWNRKTGEPIHNAIVWQDRRTAAFCDELKQNGHSEMIRDKTGLVIDAYFSGSKIKWLLDNVEGARAQAEAGELAFGTVDSWLIWQLTRSEVHATDVTNAARTMLFNIRTQQWDEELLQLFNIPKSILPEVKQSSELYGQTANNLFAQRIPIAGIAGDQHAALFGQMCIDKAMVKNTYGTGCFMLMNIGHEFIKSKNNLLTTIAWKINGEITYAFEGSIFIGGAVVQWLRDGLGIIKTSADVEKLATSVKDTAGVYFCTRVCRFGCSLLGPGSPGAIVGLTRGATAAHISRAALSSIAYQTMDVLKAMEADAGMEIKELRVDGGATANNLLMQFQSDVLNCKVIRPEVTETTALGVAYMAGLAVGYWKDIAEIQHLWAAEAEFTPANDLDEVKSGIAGWKRAVSTAQCWSNSGHPVTVI
ncbi:glycerol kinase GlpK [Mucilaginibacter sp. UC70_90]